MRGNRFGGSYGWTAGAAACLFLIAVSFLGSSATQAETSPVTRETLGRTSDMSSAREACLSEIYNSYRVVNAHMQHAGKGNQFIAFQAEVGSVECPGMTRVLSGVLQLKKKGWINMDGPLHGPHILWQLMYMGNRPGVAQMNDLNSHHLKVRTWQPGNKVRLEMRFQARSQKTGKIVGTHIRFFRIGISRGRYHWKRPNFHPEF